MVWLESLLSFMVTLFSIILKEFLLLLFQYILSYRTGEGMSQLSLADRATIANMSPEYGATMGFFPVDHVTLQYLKLTGRSDETVSWNVFWYHIRF